MAIFKISLAGGVNLIDPLPLVLGVDNEFAVLQELIYDLGGDLQQPVRVGTAHRNSGDE